MNTTFNLSFYCRPSKSDRKGLAPIEISLIINGKRTFINLPRKEYPETFRKEMTTRRNTPTKDYCNEIRRKVNEMQTDMLRNDIPITAQSLKEYFKNGGVKTYTLGDLKKDYLTLIMKRIGTDLTYSAFKKYQNAFDCMEKFIPTDTELSSVSTGKIQRMIGEMNATYEKSTVAGIITKIKTAFTYAHNSNMVNNNPFNGIKVQRPKKDIVYLTETELEQIINLNIDNDSISDVRDAFVLQSATGLAYIDIYNLKKEDIQIAEDGTHYIVKNRHKTSTQYTTVVLPFGVEVLKKHDYELHIISNQKYNAYLKVLQGMSGIKTNLTTHIARKTFATLLINRGIRMETVSKALGHSSTRITENYYAELQKNTVIKEIKSIF